jgi:hypothetical protein
MQRAHTRHAGVEGQQQVEALLGSDLADEDPAGGKADRGP